MARRASSILKALWAKPLASRSSDVGGLRESRLRSAPGRASAASAAVIAPRLVRDAAERQPRLLDRAAVELQRGRDRDQRERIGQAVADLQIGVVAPRSLAPAARPP